MRLLDKLMPSRMSEPGVHNVAKCGGFGCNNYVVVQNDLARPEIFICPSCERRINQGIVNTLHARTGHTSGGFNEIEGYKP